ncbi:hypothetical protein [Pseudomonas abieticivorans]|uniref:hypothetical protein n=1 Tax=Pseudomonas abieticivorans TaxID=2931382 RepID=UPI0020BE2D2A|nr:hypothetical protein [Pseudomonas sp. PIA16]
MSDQAAGLRRWAERQAAQGSPRVLMLVGEPTLAAQLPTLALGTLTRWQATGQQWVGDPARWRVVALGADTVHLHALTRQQPRWGLWVDTDVNGFRRAYLNLRRLSEAGGPKRLLVLHPGMPSHLGLLDNLRQAAAKFLGVQLLLVDECTS